MKQRVAFEKRKMYSFNLQKRGLFKGNLKIRLKLLKNQPSEISLTTKMYTKRKQHLVFLKLLLISKLLKKAEHFM